MCRGPTGEGTFHLLQELITTRCDEFVSTIESSPSLHQVLHQKLNRVLNFIITIILVKKVEDGDDDVVENLLKDQEK